MKPVKAGRVVPACLAGAVVALCSSCIQHIPRFSVLSNQSVDLERVDLEALEGEPTTGSTTTFSILGLIPIGRPRVETAVARALMKHDADLLTDAVVRHRETWAGLLGWETITVEGRAVKTLEATKKEQDGAGP